MFPEWDKDTLQGIVEAQGGNVDAAVGVILSMGSDGGGGDGDEPPANPDLAQADSQMSVDEMLARSLAAESYGGADTPPPLPPAQHRQPQQQISPPAVQPRVLGAESAGGPPRRGRRVELPEGFLRVAGLPAGVPASGRAPEMSEDEQLALMLQNESFMRELAAMGDPEFQGLYGQPSGRRRVYQPGAARGAAAAAAGDGGPGLSTRLKTMGEAAKRRLNTMALQFKAKQQQFQESRAPQEDGSSVPLTSGDPDDDEAEVINFDQGGAQRRGFQGAGGDGLTQGLSQGYYDEEEERLADPRSKKDT